MIREPQQFRLDDEDEEPKEERKPDAPFQMVAQRLFEARTVMIFGEINMRVARDVSAQLMALAVQSDEADQDDHQQPRRPCGERRHDLRHDPVHHAGGEDDRHRLGRLGRRADLPGRQEGETGSACRTPASCCTSRWGACAGRRSTSASRRQEIVKMRERINRIISEETGQPFEKGSRTTPNRNFWMGPKEAINYGLVSRVVNSMSEVF